MGTTDICVPCGHKYNSSDEDVCKIIGAISWHYCDKLAIITEQQIYDLNSELKATVVIPRFFSPDYKWLMKLPVCLLIHCVSVFPESPVYPVCLKKILFLTK